uniref:Serine/threonine-protein kinase PpkA n=1 Tax=Candidatus Kentrum sp. TC TaxID=2126339 RepID=A0A451ABQ0_9GAMM|nr:MAG: serine/threonine-protein kinase PpkA [Candidatus Kentron sp. TC]VFK50489.1 MAG: serine/threonine-protein kinase PpkA [Candidatus Kentron sp. TC]VFK63452.1 MAG: serine/threonine-protein kinase PpkA [Candidatus Kentron sp. TC]
MKKVKNKRNILLLFLFAVVCVPNFAFSAQPADIRKPLLMEGKRSLYQRVIAKPGANIYSQPSALDDGEPITPFTVYYVYSRHIASGVQWVEVGINAHGNMQGWVAERDLVEWKQVLTVAFRDPVGKDRVLLFRDRDSLKNLVKTRNLTAYEQLYRKAEVGELSMDGAVVAIQPEEHVDLREDFYLIPIHQHEDVYLDGKTALMLRVTSVPLVSEVQMKTKKRPLKEKKRRGGENLQERSNYRAGVVFIIDSTLSMGPYIKRTREAVRKIYARLDRGGLAKKVNFGLVDFRDNIQAVEGLEYLAKVHVTLADGASPKGFFSHMNALEPARVSSEDFIEDAYAGVKLGLDAIDWGGYDARYIVLITDAGARNARDPLSNTKLDAEELRRIAKANDVAILVLHLLTPSGISNHAVAAEQYRILSHYPGIGSFYYGVETGNVARFGRALDALANQIADQVQEVVRIELPTRIVNEKQAYVSDGEKVLPPDGKTFTSSPLMTALQKKVAKLGYALRMRYLRKHKDGKIPVVFDAWMLDRDFREPERATLDVRVLLTRNQLSDLQYVLRQVLNTAEEGLLSPRNFLNDLKSLAASLRRTPDEIGESTIAASGTGSNLADLGYMREYIEDLPYTGKIMDLSLETWEVWPAKQQLAFIDDLENRVHYYKALHDHTDLWISLDGGSINGDSVFALPLEMLP